MIVLMRKDLPSAPLDSMAEQPTCRLLCLPSELRNQIYELLLVQSDRIVPGVSRRNQRFCANILRTCKQIHSEGTPLLYGENVFLAHSNLLTALPSFLITQRPNQIKLPPVTHPRVATMIKKYHIIVRLDTDPRFSKTQATESFTGVDALEIEVFQASYGTCDFTVLKLFEGVRGVGKAKVQGSIGDGAYARWLERTMQSAPDEHIPAFYERYIGGDRAWDAWTHGNR